MTVLTLILAAALLAGAVAKAASAPQPRRVPVRARRNPNRGA